eukprot:TRINITY_DN65738_c0_g1_i1.p1 TRINITY_DN65738_c0_g1~~TRINITY_DN65738_c0_g1_i1.p1  ORF type:complete len:1402 (+),score=383.92 TRINITY_DN65738_c0_g1_i1:85-4290(+)
MGRGRARALAALMAAAHAAPTAGHEEHVHAMLEVSEDDVHLVFAQHIRHTDLRSYRQLYPPKPRERERRAARAAAQQAAPPLPPDPPPGGHRHEHGHGPPGHYGYGHMHVHRNDSEEYVHVFFHEHPEHENASLLHTFDDPRMHPIHSFDLEAEEWQTGTEWISHGTVDLVLPKHVRQVWVEYMGRRHQLDVPPSDEVRRWGRSVRRRRKAQNGRFHPLAVKDAKPCNKADGTPDPAAGTYCYEVVSYSIDEKGNQNPLPQGGPTETQNNFVFLAGGYKKGDREQFLKDLDWIVTLFDTSCQPGEKTGAADGPCKNAVLNMPPTIPFRRYASTMNLFAIWQASAEEGASVPNSGKKVDTNLDCSYGTSVPRALLCTPSLVQALSDAAPCGSAAKENVISVVLVNSDTYGGAASYRYRPTTRVGAFATKYFRPFNQNSHKDPSGTKTVRSPLGTFGSLFFHEVGHCYANLMDEYDTGITEGADKDYYNCVSPQKKNSRKTPWQGWISCCSSDAAAKSYLEGKGYTTNVDAALPFYTVAADPVGVCGWSNYFQPSSSCMMEKLTARTTGYSYSLVPRLCPVCREATILMMYKTGVDLSHPKCPLSDEKLTVSPSQGAYLFINSKFASLTDLNDGGKVDVKWRCGKSGAKAAAMTLEPWATGRPKTEYDPDQPHFLYVTATDVEKCGGGSTATVAVTINDVTPWVLDAMRPTQQSDAEPSKIEGLQKSIMEQSYLWEFTKVEDTALVHAPTVAGLQRHCYSSCMNDTQGGTFPPTSKRLYPCIDPGSRGQRSRLPTSTMPTTITNWLDGKTCSDKSTPGVAGCTGGALYSAASDAKKFDYWATCDDSGNDKAEPKDQVQCYLQFASREYNDTLAQESSAKGDSVDNMVFGLPGLIAISTVILYLVVWWRCARRFAMQRTKCLFETDLDTPVSWLRRVIIAAGVFFAIVAVAALGVGLWLYTQVGEFLKLALIGAFILAMLLFIMAFVGSTAAYFRAKVLLWVNAFGLLVSLVVMVWLTHLVVYIGENIVTPPCNPDQVSNNDSAAAQELSLVSNNCSAMQSDIALCGFDGWGCELRSLWREMVSSLPDKICNFQDELECSGYTQPCDKHPSTLYCPVGCDANHPEDRTSKYGDACKIKVQDDIEENCSKLFPIMCALTGAMAIALLNNLLLGCLLWMQESKQRDAQTRQLADFTSRSRAGGQGVVGAGSKSKAVRLLRCLDQPQREKLSKRFQEADKDGNGRLDKRELGMFLKAVLSKDLTKAETDEAFMLADTDKNGEVDFKEFVDLFDPGASKRKGGEMQPKSPASMPPKADGAAVSPTGGSPSAGYNKLQEGKPPTPVPGISTPGGSAPRGPPGRGAGPPRSRPGSLMQAPRGAAPAPAAGPPRRTAARSPVGKPTATGSV